jgi:hypothetical protein
MGLREPYQGYVLQAEPVRQGKRWAAGVVIELHEEGSIHYQPVAADPGVIYESKEEAERASIHFGKQLLDSRLASR